MAEFREGLQISPGPTSEVEHSKGGRSSYMFDQRLNVLCDVMVGSAHLKRRCDLLVMIDRSATMVVNLL